MKGWAANGENMEEEQDKEEASSSSGINIMQTIEPEGMNRVSGDSEWECLEMAVDSGASETVVNDEMVTSVETKEGMASRKGVKYEVATGVRIPQPGREEVFGNLGRRADPQHHGTGL